MMNKTNPLDILEGVVEYTEKTEQIREYYSNIPITSFKTSYDLTLIIPLGEKTKKFLVPAQTQINNFWDFELTKDIKVWVLSNKSESVIKKGTVVKGQNMTCGKKCSIISPFDAKNALLVPVENLKLIDQNHPYFLKLKAKEKQKNKI